MSPIPAATRRSSGTGPSPTTGRSCSVPMKSSTPPRSSGIWTSCAASTGGSSSWWTAQRRTAPRRQWTTGQAPRDGGTAQVPGRRPAPERHRGDMAQIQAGHPGVRISWLARWHEKATGRVLQNDKVQSRLVQVFAETSFVGNNIVASL